MGKLVIRQHVNIPPQIYKEDTEEGPFHSSSKVEEWLLFLLKVVGGVLSVCCFFEFFIRLLDWLILFNIARYLVYSLLLVPGYEFWVLPNIFEVKSGFKKMFDPFYSIGKAESSCCLTFLRVFFGVSYLLVVILSTLSFTQYSV